MTRHGFPIDAVYVMHVNHAPHPVFESVRHMGFHTIEPLDTPINTDYTATRPQDNEVRQALSDSVPRKEWRLHEARDWQHLMRTLLDTTDAPYIGINQDDAKWTCSLPPINAPITSLWSKDPKTTDCRVGWCGMVSFVFKRETLRECLDWMGDKWKEKPIDWTFNDFVKAFRYKMPVRLAVEHIGDIRSIGRELT